jgi:uncharacterized protein (UPF0332 family)
MSRKAEAIKIQLDRAKELLAEIPVHISHNFFNTALNRLYYACFYGARALTISIDLVPKTHTGILKVIHLHFVKSELLDESFSILLARLLQLRSKADYDGLFTTSKSEVESLYEE